MSRRDLESLQIRETISFADLLRHAQGFHLCLNLYLDILS